MTVCILCAARGLARSAKPVKVGVPLCAECRADCATRLQAAADATPVLTIGSGDSADQLARYAMRLTIAQAPARALAAMKPAGSA